MMYFEPDLVRTDRIENTLPITPPIYAEYPVRKDLIPETGVLATAYSSSAEKGKMIVDAAVPALKRIVETSFCVQHG